MLSSITVRGLRYDIQEILKNKFNNIGWNQNYMQSKKIINYRLPKSLNPQNVNPKKLQPINEKSIQTCYQIKNIVVSFRSLEQSFLLFISNNLLSLPKLHTGPVWTKERTGGEKGVITIGNKIFQKQQVTTI